MKNPIDAVILDNYKRLNQIDGEPNDVLAEAQIEILAAATPELTAEVLLDTGRAIPERETRSATAQMRAFNDLNSLTNRSSQVARNAYGLAAIRMLRPRQGYIGGVFDDNGELIVFGHSTARQISSPDDPIQEVMGDTFYPPMMWVKALRAVAYKRRPESARDLSVTAYLSKLGLSLGSMVTRYGDAIGATGFMPGDRLEALSYDPTIWAHIEAEPVAAFRLSGLCDQAVVEPDILLNTKSFAEKIIKAGGNLN